MRAMLASGRIALIALIGLAGLGLASARAAEEPPAETSAPAPDPAVDEVERCLRSNQPEVSAWQLVDVEQVDRNGSSTRSKAEIAWARFDDGVRTLLRFQAPPDVRGSAILMVENGDAADMWMYLPEFRKVRRVSRTTVGSSLFGTDFSFEDFERLQGLSGNRESQRLPDEEIDGRTAYVVDSRPARGEDSEYERIRTWVDRERCLPLRIALFASGDRLLKEVLLPPEAHERLSERWVPRHVRVADRVNDTHTDLRVEKLELEKGIPKRDFTQAALARGR